MNDTQAPNERRATGYQRPVVRDYGSLVVMTQACSGSVIPPELGGFPIISTIACP